MFGCIDLSRVTIPYFLDVLKHVVKSGTIRSLFWRYIGRLPPNFVGDWGICGLLYINAWFLEDLYSRYRMSTLFPDLFRVNNVDQISARRTMYHVLWHLHSSVG